MNYVLSYEEYEKLDEGIKSSIAKAAAGAMLAAGLGGNAMAGDDPDGPNYNHADHKVDTIGNTYNVNQLRKYNDERAFSSYKDFKKYQDKHTHKLIPYYSFKDKEMEFLDAYNGHYQRRYQESFFFDLSGDDYTSFGVGFADQALAAAHKRAHEGKTDIDDPILNFKILRRPGTKTAIALNDKLKLAVDIKDLDKFMKRLADTYIVTPIGDSYDKNGDDSKIFSDKKDNVEWFNISPKPHARRLYLNQ